MGGVEDEGECVWRVGGGSVVRLRLGEGFSHPQRAWRNSIWPGSKVLLGARFCLVASYRR